MLEYTSELFDLTETGETRGDCSAPYNVTLKKKCTVREFINAVLDRSRLELELGYIYLGDMYDYHV